MDGRTLSKLEERAIKDYLRVYRSEFATLKKKAKAKKKKSNAKVKTE